MNAPAVKWALRTAREADGEFLRELFVSTMRESIAEMWGTWDSERWEEFFWRHFESANYLVASVDGEDIGALAVEWRPIAVYLDTVEIVPAWQNRGLGTALIRGVQHSAWVRGLPVTLQVNRANRSRLLYERLGFEQYGGTTTHILMRASPPDDSPPITAVLEGRSTHSNS